MKNDSQQEERLAWRLKEKQILYDERWLHLESRSYQLADGTVIEPYYVTCPNDFTVIVAVTENGSFLMERLYRPGAEMIMTEPPFHPDSVFPQVLHFLPDNTRHNCWL